MGSGLVQPGGPTRVSIDSVKPGDTVAFLGDTLDVTADVTGLREGEPVTLYYTTADGEVVDRAVAMTHMGERNQMQCSLPPGKIGLQQDIRYRLQAGDCTTRTFHIETQVAPSILVDQINYQYPDYTGLPPQRAG